MRKHVQRVTGTACERRDAARAGEPAMPGHKTMTAEMSAPARKTVVSAVMRPAKAVTVPTTMAMPAAVASAMAATMTTALRERRARQRKREHNDRNSHRVFGHGSLLAMPRRPRRKHYAAGQGKFQGQRGRTPKVSRPRGKS
jgi:hypothetical protein